MTTLASRPVPLVDLEQAGPVMKELHRWLLEHGFLQLERYPWPGRLSSLYYDPGILFRYVTGGSNCWQASTLSSAYYAWLRQSQPTLWTLCQAFMLCEPVACDRLENQLTRERCVKLQDAGILATASGSYVSCVRATPWEGRVLWHDAPPAFRRSFAFLGADSVVFARHLARWVRRGPEMRYRLALDLCTGVGIHAFMLATIADQVVGADVNPRAIGYARLNAALQNIKNTSFVVSDLFAGVPEGPYDLIVSNAPFVFLPEELRRRCVDGDGGALGMELVLRLVDGLAGHLLSNGTAILHANSAIVDGRDLLIDGLHARLGGGRWQITLTPTHEFQDASFYALYRAHRIQRFVTYVIIIQAGKPFRLERRPLTPWRKAACAVRIALAHAQTRLREHCL